MADRSLVCLLGVLAAVSWLLVDARHGPILPMAEDDQLQSSTPKVNVTLYSEALCPYCAEFITGPLKQLFDNGLVSIVTLRVVPYGNAVELKNGTVVCQHGPPECMLNRIQACAIHFYPQTTQWFGFVSCIESQRSARALDAWPQCAVAMGLDVNRIQSCAAGDLGKKLDHANAAKTAALDPPHQWVPWVVVDGKQLQDLDSLFHVICHSYRGEEKPEVCSNQGSLQRTVQAACLKDAVLHEGDLVASTKYESVLRSIQVALQLLGQV